MSDKNQITTLIQGYQRTDPRLYDILQFIASDIDDVKNQLNLVLSPETVADEDSALMLPLDITYYIPGDLVRINWNHLDKIGIELPVSYSFELRKGSVWDTSLFVTRTRSYSVSLAPDLSTGSHQYLLKVIGSSGKYSVDALSLIIEIQPISAVSISAQVIDNNILFYWLQPQEHSFNIAKYEMFREGVSLGLKYGTFTATFENTGGDFAYSIIAYDLADNVSEATNIDVHVSAPPDFEVVGNQLSTFTGTKTNCVVMEGKLVGPVYDEHWDDHFTKRSWDTIQDQIDAGYPYYLQPSYTSGGYQETFDFGMIFTGVIVNISWGSEQVAPDGTVQVECEIEGSDDGSAWSSPISGVNAYFASMRYIRITLELNPSNDKALVVLSDLYCSVNIKYGVDSGEVLAEAADASGTAVLFNKAFKDINSITLTVYSIEPVTAIYDFTDVPNPTGFLVFALDSSGTRIDYNISWKARGVL
jgi:hypothetical protein